MFTPCLFCGEDASEPGHADRCDGRQGAIEAAEDLDLYARQSDPETSHDSMAAYDRRRMSAAVSMVVSIFEECGRLADYELQGRFEAAFAAPHSLHLYRPARSVARDRGRIRDSGDRIVNPTSRRRQIVWESCHAPAPEIVKCPTCGHLMRRRETD
jgi:hypothetical protein